MAVFSASHRLVRFAGSDFQIGHLPTIMRSRGGHANAAHQEKATSSGAPHEDIFPRCTGKPATSDTIAFNIMYGSVHASHADRLPASSNLPISRSSA